MKVKRYYMITVSIKVKGSIEQIWDYFTNPEHIIHWNFASEDWYSPWAKNDLRVGGKWKQRMEVLDLILKEFTLKLHYIKDIPMNLKTDEK